MKIVFMGTPDFSVPCLDAVISAGHNVPLVVTQSDKPRGRGHKMTPPPVKEAALSYGISVFQPDTMKSDEVYETLREIEADLFVVVAYGKILPERILNLPKFGCVNVHASILPKYRGAAPIQRVIMDGEAITGVTTMQMDVGLDTGDMLISREIKIQEDETGESLHDKLSLLGKDVLLETLRALEDNSLSPKKQDDTKACYAAMIDKTVSKIDFSQNGEVICRLVRAMNSYPYAHTTYQNKLLKICKAKYVKANNITGVNGEILSVNENTLQIKCADGLILAEEIQLEGKKRMLVSEYAKGNSFTIGTVLQ